MTNRTAPAGVILAALAALSSPLHAAPLTIGAVEGGRYGYFFGDVLTNREAASFEFTGGSSDLTLSYTAYDIDWEDEVAIELNGSRIGYLVTTPDSSTADGSIVIDAGDLVSGSNTLVFRQARAVGYKWGITNIRLNASPPSLGAANPTSQAARPLTLDVTDDAFYGYRFLGPEDYQAQATFRFDGAGTDLTLYYTSYDVDFDGEVSVELNGNVVGNLPTTEDGGFRDDYIDLPASLQVNGRNTLVFRQATPGYIWGVRSLLLVDMPWCP